MSAAHQCFKLSNSNNTNGGSQLGPVKLLKDESPCVDFSAENQQVVQGTV